MNDSETVEQEVVQDANSAPEITAEEIAELRKSRQIIEGMDQALRSDPTGAIKDIAQMYGIDLTSVAERKPEPESPSTWGAWGDDGGDDDEDINRRVAKLAEERVKDLVPRAVNEALSSRDAARARADAYYNGVKDQLRKEDPHFGAYESKLDQMVKNASHEWLPVLTTPEGIRSMRNSAAFEAYKSGALTRGTESPPNLAPGGGGTTSVAPQLSDMEKQVARAAGMTDEQYIELKGKS